MTETLSAGKWFVECLPEDGGRISRLSYDGVELLTAPPTGTAAIVPEGAGPFERKPVYGYDDCLPTVDACVFPRDGKPAGDHGLLVYLPWQVSTAPGRMTCRVECSRLEARFTRELRFEGRTLTWRFEIVNDGGEDLPFLHVMHGLMPLHDVTAIEFPEFDEVVDEGTDRSVCSNAPGKLARHLLEAPAGYAKTLLVRGMKSGEVTATFRGRVALRMTQPVDLLPNSAIWWNKTGWPGGAGKGRSECAFEPLAGRYSTIDRSAKTGRTQVVRAGRKEAWVVTWEAVEA